MRAHAATWNDLNGNFAFDAPAETRKAWELAVAVTRKGKDKDKKDEGRMLLVADSDFMSDGVIGAYGNPLFVLDGAKWLVGDESDHRRSLERERRADRPHQEAGPGVVLRLVVPRADARARHRVLRRRPPTRPRGAQGEAVMNVRGAAVQSGLAALGLVVAYTTWQREPERAPGEVIVIDVNKSDVQKVRFDDGAGK